RQHPDAGVAREPRCDRAPPVDVAHRRARAADVRPDRPRSRPGHVVGRPVDARPAPQHRAREARRRPLPEDDPTARRPDLDPDRPWAHVRRNARLGRATLARRRPRGAGPRELEVGEAVTGGPGPARLHAERDQLDYTQNAINKTLVAPFSVRPAPGAPVSI